MKKMMLQILDVLDSGFSIALTVVCSVFMLYGGYALYDNWQLVQGVYEGRDALIDLYKPRDNAEDNTILQLQAINPDVCGWVSLDGTRIDYPFVIGMTNFEYLNKSVYGEYSLSGSIFLDYRSNRNLENYYTLFFGHHMDQGLMFGDIDLYASKPFFDMRTTGKITLADKEYGLEVIAYISTDAYDSRFFSPDVVNQYADNFLPNVINAATFYRTPSAQENLRFVAFSTCASDYSNARSLVIAQLIEAE